MFSDISSILAVRWIVAKLSSEAAKCSDANGGSVAKSEAILVEAFLGTESSSPCHAQRPY